MNAMPQLIRCFERQWQGLDEPSRHWLKDNVAVPGFVRFRPDDMPPSRMVVIWHVERSTSNTVWAPNCLMSIKTD